MTGSRTPNLSRRRLITSAIGLGAAAVGVSRIGAGASPLHQSSTLLRMQKTAAELTIALTSSDQIAAQPLFDEYTRRTGIKITTVVNTYSSHYTKINISLTQSTGAFDIVSLDDPWMPRFAGPPLVNLTTRMEKDGVEPDSDLIPELVKLGRFPNDSGLFGMPWVGNVQLFTWRNDLLSQLDAALPVTWDDVLALATRISREIGGGVYGFGLRGKTGNASATTFLPVLRGFGKDLFDPVSSEPQLDSKEAFSAIEMLMNLKMLTPPGAETTDHDKNGSNLRSGLIAMSADIWPDQLLRAEGGADSTVTGLLDMGLEPAQRGVQRSNVTGAWMLGIASGSKNIERAAEFIYWFTAKEQQKRLLLESAVPPARTSVLHDPDTLAIYPFLPAMATTIRYAKPRLRTPYYRAMEEICGQYVTEALTAQKPGRDAMIDANAEIRKLLVREGVLS